MTADERKSRRMVAALAVGCIAAVVLISGKPDFTNASRPVRGIDNPGLAMQMARNVHEVDAILSDAPSPDREAMRIKQYIDFAFIAFYAGLYVALARVFRNRVATAAAVLGVLAAIADVTENFGILRIVDVPLAATTQGMVDAIRVPSYVKWSLTAIAFGIFGSLFVAAAGWLRKAIGIAFGAAAVMVVVGLLENSLLAYAFAPLGLGLAGLVVFGLWPRMHAHKRE